jgi:hypothetical protein
MMQLPWMSVMCLWYAWDCSSRSKGKAFVTCIILV